MPEDKPKNAAALGKELPKDAKGKEIDSNHNTVEPAKPIPVANITDPKEAKPDYNPMRREGSKANVNSDTSMSKDDNENVVAEKGENQTALANERDRLNAIPEDEATRAQINAKNTVNAANPSDGAKVDNSTDFSTGGPKAD